MKSNIKKISIFTFLLMSVITLFSFSNLKINAADVAVYQASSGTPDTSNYTLVKNYSDTTFRSTDDFVNVDVPYSTIGNQNIIVTFAPYSYGGDTRDITLLESPTYINIAKFGETDTAEIIYNGMTAGEFNYTSSHINFKFYSPYGQNFYEGVEIKIYKSNYQPDVVEPVIDTEQYVYITSVSNPTSIANMQSAVNLQAHDEIDGDLTSSIVVESDGGYNLNVKNKTNIADRVLGDYAIRFSVTDNSDNTAYVTITIRVVDTDKPVINTSTSTLTYSTGYYNQEITTATILAGIVATDNHSTNLTKTIVSNNYTANKGSIGSYSVVVQVTDTSGNYSRVTVTITVYDNVKPTITGGTSFYKSYDVAKSVNDIISFLNIQATDSIDGALTIANGKLTISQDTYTGSANQPGTYLIKLKATDSRGNFIEHTINVTVGDDVIPFFLINKNRVIIETGVNISSTMLVQTLKDVGVIENKSLSFTVVNDTYSGNENIPGEYRYDMKVLYNDGIEKIMELEVEVVENEDDSINVPVKDFWAKIANFFVKLWHYITLPFIWIFNYILKPIWNFLF